MTLASWMYSGEDAVPEPAEEKWVEIDGRRIRYLKAGSGPDLVLLHGILGSAACWEEVVPHLTKESTVYTIDAIGSGKSDRAADIDSSLEAAVDRLLAFLNTAGLGRIDLLGTSHGGAVAMLFAARYPGRVRSLILHAPANPYSRIADPLIFFYKTSFGDWFAHRLLMLPMQLQKLALARMYGTANEIRNGVVERYVEFLRQPGTIDCQLAIVRHLPDDMKILAKEIARLRRRSVLLLWGTHDRVVSLQSGLILKKALENSTLTLLPGTGHLPYEECPEEFARAVNLFLRKQNRENVLRPILVEPGPSSIPSAA